MNETKRERYIRILSGLGGADITAEACKELVELLKEQPERPKEWKWIPVSERLPEKDGRYLVAYWLMKDYMWMSIAWFGEAVMPNRPMHGRYFYINGEYGEVVWDNVLAWMPLPEPYRKDGEEE